MGTVRKYKIDPLTASLWHSLVGVDDETIANNLKTEGRYLDELSLVDIEYIDGEKLPVLSRYIDDEMKKIIERLCEMGNYPESGDLSQQQLLFSTYIILNTATSLNVIEEDSYDYELHFKRLSKIILLALQTINFMDNSDVIYLASIIGKKDIKLLLETGHQYGELPLLCILAMTGDSNSKDYEIFDENSGLFNKEKITELICNNIGINNDFNLMVNRPYRLSLKKSIELKKEMELLKKNNDEKNN